MKDHNHYWMESVKKLTHTYWENENDIHILKREITTRNERIAELQSHNQVISEQFGKGLQIKYIPKVEDLTKDGIRKYVEV